MRAPATKQYEEVLAEIDLRLLRAFIAVADELHFGRAARRLHIAQPPLSRQIRALEEAVGAPLLRRTSRRVELTAAGRALLDEARGLVAQVEQAVLTARRVHGGDAGRLTIGFVGSATQDALPRVVRAFRQRHPGVDLALAQLTTAQQVAALREHRLDVGLVRPPVPADDLRLAALVREPLVAALPADHALVRRSSLALSALARERFVLFPRAFGAGLYDQIMSACRRAGFSPEVVQEATEMQTIPSLVAAGLGVALVPRSAATPPRLGIARLALRGMPARVELGLAWRRDESSAAVQHFVDVARAAMGPVASS